MNSQNFSGDKCPNCDSYEIRSKTTTLDRNSGKPISPVARWISGGSLIALGGCMALAGVTAISSEPNAFFMLLCFGSLFLVPGIIVVINYLRMDKAKLIEYTCGTCQYKWKQTEVGIIAGAPTIEGVPSEPQIKDVLLIDCWQSAISGEEPSSAQIEITPELAILSIPGAKHRINKTNASTKIEFPEAPFEGKEKASHLDGFPVIHFGDVRNIVLKPDAYGKLVEWVPPKESIEDLVEKNKNRMIRGLVWTIAGIAITWVSYNMASEEGGTYLICGGAVIFGIIDLLAGLFGWLKYKYLQ